MAEPVGAEVAIVAPLGGVGRGGVGWVGLVAERERERGKEGGWFSGS